MVQYCYCEVHFNVNLFICKDMNAIFSNWDDYKFTGFILANFWMLLYLFQGDQIFKCVLGLICFIKNDVNVMLYLAAGYF